MVTAGLVFGVGMLLLPANEPEAPPPPPQLAPPPAPPPAPVPAPSDAAAEAGSDASSPGDAADALGSDVSKPKLAVAPSEPEPKPAEAKSKAEDKGQAKGDDKTGDKTTPKPEAKSAPESTHGKVTDKDVARESWRKNLPDITAEPGKSALLIPVKGSTAGATYHVTTKPKSVLITMPKGESMITMPFYNIRHDGFRQLWIKTDETTKATTIRVVLGDATEPQVEIKDDFVRVTVRRPVDASGTAEAPAAGTPTPLEHD